MHIWCAYIFVFDQQLIYTNVFLRKFPHLALSSWPYKCTGLRPDSFTSSVHKNFSKVSMERESNLTPLIDYV